LLRLKDRNISENLPSLNIIFAKVDDQDDFFYRAWLLLIENYLRQNEALSNNV